MFFEKIEIVTSEEVENIAPRSLACGNRFILCHAYPRMGEGRGGLSTLGGRRVLVADRRQGSVAGTRPSPTCHPTASRSVGEDRDAARQAHPSGHTALRPAPNSVPSRVAAGVWSCPAPSSPVSAALPSRGFHQADGASITSLREWRGKQSLSVKVTILVLSAGKPTQAQRKFQQQQERLG